MSTVTLTKDTIDDIIGAEGITLVDWWAEWCGPCKQFGPVFEAASEQHTDVVFGKIDTEDQRGSGRRRADHLDPDADGLPRRRPGVLTARRPPGSRTRADHHGGQGPRHGRRTSSDRRPGGRRT